MGLYAGKAVTQVYRNNKETCVALSITNGAELWARALETGANYSGYTGPRSTPTIDQDSVCVLTSNLKLFRLNLANGAVVWSNNLAAAFGGAIIGYANAASPLLDGALIYVNLNTGNQSLAAFWATNGALAWRGQDELTTHSTPVVARGKIFIGGRQSDLGLLMCLDEKTGEGTVSLSFTPEEVGSQNLSVLVPRQLGESLTANNTVRLPLKVVRDKIRILMITGSPSMSYRYMRMALKNDPSIDLLSFVILRLPSNILNVPLQEQSLIPFPVETLFTKELKDFDLLIFDDFQSSLFFKAQYLENVRDFVKKGGAFAIIGGPAFIGEGGYAGTAIEEILPVRWAGKEGYRRNSPLGVKLSRAGRVHPLTRLSPLEGEDLSLWGEMSPLDGVNPLRPKSSGTVLLESTEENSWPILTVGSYGKGRVLVLATDDSWKWYMGMVAQGKGNWAYLRLMERMVRWLTKDPSLEPVQVTFPEISGTTGQETELRVRVQEDPAFSKAGMAISASVINPEGSKISSQIKPVGQTGEYLLSFLPGKEGTYKVKVETRAGSWEESMVIGGPAENLDGFPNHELLKKISASTRGKTLTGGDDFLKELKSYEEGARNRFIEESRHPLWGNAYIFILLLTLLTMEWYFRRRWGLI
ncbi:MAG: PQQ-binding-like beta-propeller repeat protein [Thermodesulfobacteriota bacterium]